MLQKIDIRIVRKKRRKTSKTKQKKQKTKKLQKRRLSKPKKAKRLRLKNQKKAVYRVIFSKENNVWQIKKDGARRVIDSKVTKEEALERVKQLSESQEIKFVVHKKDGKFQKKSNLR